ncbi:MAG: carboxypeptidase-like regulatory domain-containing protein, partial [Terracidiphilus sp.]
MRINLEGQFRQLWTKLALPLALLLAAIPTLRAQTTASLSGTVTDTTGAVVPGAAVTATNDATQDKTVTLTGGAGTYSFPVLLPGTYTVSVAAKGFEGEKQIGIVLTAGLQAQAPAIALKIGAATETVTVTLPEGTVLQTENGQLGGVLNSADLQTLALESQNTLELLKVMPGITTVANYTGNGLQFDFFNTGTEGSPIGVGLATNGVPNRGGTADLLDGVNINDPGCNCWSIALILPDWVQEVSYQAANFGADVSHGPTVVSSISKGGTSRYHGQGYFYARNDFLNANDWADNHNGTPRGTAHYYYPGGDVGGPIPFTHKKLLGWFGYENLIQNTGNAYTLTSHIPTPAMMGGDFSLSDAAGQALCQSGIGSTKGTYCDNLQGTDLPDGTTIGVTPGVPVGHIPAQFTAAGGYTPAQYAADLAKIWPQPNATPSSGNGFANFYQPVPGVHDGHMWRARLDYDINEATKLYVSYQYGYDSSPENGSGAHIYWTPGNSIPFPGGSMQGLETTKVLSGHLTHVFGSTLTNELVGSVGYGNNPIAVPNPSAVYKTTLAYPGGTVFGTNDKWIPSYNSAGTYTFPDFSQQDIFAGSDYPLLKEAPSAYDNVIKVLGRHTIKTGVFYEMINNDQGGFNTANGVYSFSGGPANNVVTGVETGSPNNPVANFVIGNASSYSENSANPRADEAYKTISVYGDDSWKVLKNVTFEYGVRFDHMGRWYDRGTSGIPVFSAAKVQSDFNGGALFPGLSYYGINPAVPKSGMTTPFLVLSPRIGLSYDIFGTGKTVARGGWGVYRWNDQYGDYSGGIGDAQGVKGYNLPGSKTVLLNQVGTGATGLTPPTSTATATCCAGTIYAVSASDSNRIPTTYMYNFTIDQQLPWRSVLEVAYVGNQSTNALIGGGSSAVLSGGDYINQNKMPLGALFNADPVTGVVAPDPENISGPGSPK